MATSIPKSKLPSKLWKNRVSISRSFQSTLTTREYHSTVVRKYDPRVFKVSEEIKHAVETAKPIVALESQIYTHGHGYDHDFALQLELIVRENGAVPATIAVLDGVARVGMNTEELLRISDSVGNDDTMKVSRRDLSFVAGLVRVFHGLLENFRTDLL